MTESEKNIQLWQFMLSLLNDKKYVHVMQWRNELEPDNRALESEFRINDPNELAKLWGQTKGNESMKFASLSRTLRTYQSNGIMVKSRDDDSVYRFNFDLKTFSGYDSSEIAKLKAQ